ncbi:hypothetical protein PGB90_007849 [Kerria lacca]
MVTLETGFSLHKSTLKTKVCERRKRTFGTGLVHRYCRRVVTVDVRCIKNHRMPN